MNRIDRMFEELDQKGEAALMCYLPAIGPDFKRSMEVIDAFVDGGVDMIELSVPGGAPWLDGAPMQTHHKQSRDTHIDTEKAFELGKQVRERYPQLPILPMAYYAAVARTGLEQFIAFAAEADVDGIELPDYPSYSAGDPRGFHSGLRAAGIYNINFCDGISLAPEGSPNYALLKDIATDVDGFLFLTATPGVTGGQGEVAVAHLSQAVQRIRAVQQEAGRLKPILVGFGLTRPEHVRQVIQQVGADAVVVGSAVSRLINQGEPATTIRDFIA
ncbi:MAG: tryptophan synthase subunit alpha, partial [Anaerolineales bacterium]